MCYQRQLSGIAVPRTSISEKNLLPLLFTHLVCQLWWIVPQCQCYRCYFFSAELLVNGCVARGLRENALDQHLFALCSSASETWGDCDGGESSLELRQREGKEALFSEQRSFRKHTLWQKQIRWKNSHARWLAVQLILPFLTMKPILFKRKWQLLAAWTSQWCSNY